jgi:hypothetical protein
MESRLDVGAVLRQVFGIYVDQAPVLMPAAAAVFVFTGLLSILVVSAGSGLQLLTLFIGLVANSLFTAMVVELVADLRDGKRDAKAADLIRAATPVVGAVILIGVVAALGTIVGFLCFVVPGVILMTVWSVAVPVIVLERPPGLRALGRSRELVRGNGWQVFGAILVLDLLVTLLVGAGDVAAESGGTGAGIVARVVLGVLSAPIPALGAAVLYFELGGRATVPAPGSAFTSPAPPSSPFGES